MLAPARRSARLVASASLTMALVAACGSDGPDVDDAGAEPVDDESSGTDESSGDGDGGDDETAAEPNGIVIDVVATDNVFRPEDIEIEAGTEIRWENRGRSGHNVLPVDDALDWGVQVDEFLPGDDYVLLFDTPGTYPYYCSLHGTTDFGMIGTIVVTG